ncbi:MAG: outer membrane protein OmpA-like peptidoglycan-associated protein [Saprospiraceae bacterium]|jgi:outer membrane protein OmpA-like peptidoglycan-associated protein
MKNIKLLSIGFLMTIFIAGCTYTQKIKDGASAYELKQYAVAIKMLPNEFEKAEGLDERSKLATMLADSYRVLNKPTQSKKWFLKSYELTGNPESLKNYAFALKELEEYGEAVKAFEDLITATGDAFLWRKEVAACQQSQGWIDNAEERSEYILENSNFNSSKTDASPTIYKSGQVIFLSDRGTGAEDEEVYQWTGESFMDMFIANPKTGEVEVFEKSFNSPYNEGTITFNADFTEAFFTRCGSDSKEERQYCKIMYSQNDGDEWTKPIPLTDIMIEKTNYMHPTLSEDGNTLYFATDITDGYGGFDIYYSRRRDEGWTLPDNMGSSINTEGYEVFPFIDKDTFYFSSDFHVGMGGLDIFKTTKSRSGRWSPLQNLRSPINSGSDDFGYAVDYQSQKLDTVLQVGYLSSNRAGNDDIYKYSKVILPPKKVIPPPIEEIIDTTEIVGEPEFKFILEINTLESVFAKADDPSSGAIGKDKLPNTKIKISFGSESLTIETDENGQYEMELTLEQSYNFFGSKNGYLNNSTTFSSRDIKKDEGRPVRRFKVSLELNKEIIGKEFTLENIYYDFSRFEIRANAEPTLNILARMLQENPGLKIQLSSHTDCRGNNDYNEWLSQQRAESAVKYLIGKGIDSDKLVAKGYGESRPTAICVCNTCTEEAHQQNRRTTFIILE